MNTSIEIRLFATLSKYSPQNANTYPVRPGQTISSVLNELGIPAEKAKLIFKDGVRVKLETQLKGGERIGIFPPVGGG